MEDLQQKTTDLSQMLKQKEQNLAPTGASVPKKVFSFSKAKQKQKIELIVLIIIVVLTTIVFIYYFKTNKRNLSPIEQTFIPAADGGI
jgi:t-SNARE complex subunit (syntaxin)